MMSRWNIPKIRWKRIFVIPIILLLLLIPALYLNSVAGYLGAVFFVILLILSLFSLQYIKRNILVTGSSAGYVCLRGDRLKVGMNLVNESLFVAPKVKISFFLESPLRMHIRKKEVSMSLESGRKNQLVIQSRFDHVGVYHLGIKDYTLYDMLGFFSEKVNVNKRQNIIVKPRIYHPERELSELSPTETEQEQGVLMPGGMDYMGIREYQWGDPMKQIHWKLSSRQGEYYTRLTESPRRSSHTIILDLSADADWKSYWLDVNDTLIEFSLSLLTWMLDQGEDFQFIYENSNQKAELTIPSREEIPDLFLQFGNLSEADAPNHSGADQLLTFEEEEGYVASDLTLCTAALTDELFGILTDFRRQGRNVEIYEVVPKELSDKARERVITRVTQLGELGIRCHLITTRINEEEL